MKMIDEPMAPIYLIMLDLSSKVKYNPYDISDHPGPVSEMTNDIDKYLSIA